MFRNYISDHHSPEEALQREITTSFMKLKILLLFVFRMSQLPVFPRTCVPLLCILGMILLTSGFPQPRLPLRWVRSEPMNEPDTLPDIGKRISPPTEA